MTFSMLAPSQDEAIAHAIYYRIGILNQIIKHLEESVFYTLTQISFPIGVNQVYVKSLVTYIALKQFITFSYL